METLPSIAALLLAILQLAVPQRFALVPLLIAACHLPVVTLLIPNTTAMRVLLLILLIRAALSERPPLPRVRLDFWVAAWSCVLVVTGFWHLDQSDHNPITTRLGLVFDYAGAYVCGRIYLCSASGLTRYARAIAWIIMPLAGAMLVEKLTGFNIYGFVGADYNAIVRNGQVRASGSFGNAILAGTMGAATLPLVLLLWRTHPLASTIGAIASTCVVFASASSGPYLTFAFVLFGYALWPFRAHLRLIRLSVIAALVLLHFVMNDPVWYLMARIEVSEGSTAYHRAELITQALNHLDEWWAVGTEYTRHWLPYGIEWSRQHVDVTNYFLKMGVLGGLALMITFVAIFVAAFSHIGNALAASDELLVVQVRNAAWAMGLSLAAYCVAFLGVAPYDQTVLFIFLLIGAAPSLANEAASIEPSLARTASLGFT
jgi:hypothetical protein